MTLRGSGRNLKKVEKLVRGGCQDTGHVGALLHPSSSIPTSFRFVAPVITRRRDHDVHAFDCHFERHAQRIVAHAGNVLHAEGGQGFLLKAKGCRYLRILTPSMPKNNREYLLGLNRVTVTLRIEGVNLACLDAHVSGDLVQILFGRRDGEGSVDPEAKKIQREDKENVIYTFCS